MLVGLLVKFTLGPCVKTALLRMMPLHMNYLLRKTLRFVEFTVVSNSTSDESYMLRKRGYTPHHHHHHQKKKSYSLSHNKCRSPLLERDVL